MFQNDHSLPYGHFGTFTNQDEDNEDFTERLRKTLYYGKLPGTDRPSLPLTDMAVEFFQEAAPRKLGRLDTYFAASSARSACMTPTSVIVGMMYVKRLQKRKPEYLAQISSSELFLISMMMASKFLYDEGVDEEVFNDEWATSGDLDTEDVNELEREFLNAMDWELFVRPDDFANMLDTVEKRVALRQGLGRGWFSYTDLCILSEGLKFMNWNDLATELSKVVSVSSLAYLASILTMIGSTVLGTSTSTTLVSAGAAMFPLSHDATAFLPSMPQTSDLGAILMDRLATPKTEPGNVSGVEFGLPESMTDPDAGLSTENTNVHHNRGEMNKMEEESRGVETETSAEMGGRDQGTFFNGFLPPFLALVALKDTLVKFAYAVAEKPDTNANTIPGDETEEIDQGTEICSDGPCLMDSWPNCWNVSSEFDWSQFKAFHARCDSIRDPQCMYGSHVAQSWPEFGAQEQCKLRNKNNMAATTNQAWMGVASGVHCCCKWPGSLDPDQSLNVINLLQPQLPDLAFGFMTSSIFITA